jgi:hypothetical protein
VKARKNMLSYPSRRSTSYQLWGAIINTIHGTDLELVDTNSKSHTQ